MLKINSDLSDFLIDNFEKIDLKRVEVALEHETIRIKSDTEKISSKNHPEIFEPKQDHKYITTDFSESQMELITPVYCTSEALYNFSNTLYDISALAISDDEVLLPYSMPLKIEDENEIKEANFIEDENGIKSRNYRLYLSNKYGKTRQTISGIHFNFSLCEKFIAKFTKNGISKNDIYLKIVRNYNKYKFLTVALIGASPICDDSLANEKLDKKISVRNSKYGYRNLTALNIDYSSVDNFIKSVNRNIDNKNIIDEREIYESVRIKTKSKNLLSDLQNSDIKYIEIRNIDINPYEKGGISIKQIELLKYIIFYCLIKEEDNAINNGDLLSDFVAESFELNTEIPFMDNLTLKQLLLNVLNDMLLTFKKVSNDTLVLEEYIDDLKNEQLLYKKVYNDIEKFGYNTLFLNLAKQYKEDAYNNRFKLYGYENMELSTQILLKQCIVDNIDFEVVDIFDNFIKISKNGKTEYIKQATKTSLDNYATVCAMENKVVTKKILDENGIKVPKGSDFLSKTNAIEFAKNFKSGFVVKPKSTNFGIGISIFKEKATEEDIKKAVDIAFSHDNTIIIEEFIDGNEYRFLVIGDETVGVLNRVPANVEGDGEKSIKELVEIKNLDPLRGKGYKTPLEKIVIDENVKMFLKSQNIDENCIPKKNEIIYLRHNSNISTGGDSIDLTDEVDNYYKDIAVNAAKAIGAKFCGVDIIIDNYKKKSDNYSIIELNFNPAIHIHSYPYKGVERNIAKKIITLFDF